MFDSLFYKKISNNALNEYNTAPKKLNTVPRNAQNRSEKGSKPKKMVDSHSNKKESTMHTIDTYNTATKNYEYNWSFIYIGLL